MAIIDFSGPHMDDYPRPLAQSPGVSNAHPPEGPHFFFCTTSHTAWEKLGVSDALGVEGPHFFAPWRALDKGGVHRSISRNETIGIWSIPTATNGTYSPIFKSHISGWLLVTIGFLLVLSINILCGWRAGWQYLACKCMHCCLALCLHIAVALPLESGNCDQVYIAFIRCIVCIRYLFWDKLLSFAA